jgi:hypothetical protein
LTSRVTVSFWKWTLMKQINLYLCCASVNFGLETDSNRTLLWFYSAILGKFIDINLNQVTAASINSFTNPLFTIIQTFSRTYFELLEEEFIFSDLLVIRNLFLNTLSYFL